MAAARLAGELIAQPLAPTSPKSPDAVGGTYPAVRPVLGHCPPTPLVDRAESFDFHDYLARSSNWYQAVLGVAGLGLPDGKLTAGAQAADDLTARPVDSWPAATPIVVAAGSVTVASACPWP